MKFNKLLIITAVLLLTSGAVFAAQGDVGFVEVGVIKDLLSGNAMLIAAVSVSMLGLWTWMMKQSSWGFILLILGALLAAFPSLFESMFNASSDFLRAVGFEQRDELILDEY